MLLDDAATTSLVVCPIVVTTRATFQPLPPLFHSPPTPHHPPSPLSLFRLARRLARTCTHCTESPEVWTDKPTKKIWCYNGNKMEFKPLHHVAVACLIVVIAAVWTGSAQAILSSVDSNRTGARNERYSDSYGMCIANTVTFFYG